MASFLTELGSSIVSQTSEQSALMAVQEAVNYMGIPYTVQKRDTSEFKAMNWKTETAITMGAGVGGALILSAVFLFAMG